MPNPTLNLEEDQSMKDAALTVVQVAALLGIDRRSVSRAMDRGELLCVRVGSRRLVPRLQLLTMFDGSATPAA